MTDDKRSQEADGAWVILALVEDAKAEGWTWKRLSEEIGTQLAGLVREGQIRELEAMAKKMCHGGGLSGCTDEKHYEPFCPAAFVHARIAALKQEG